MRYGMYKKPVMTQDSREKPLRTRFQSWSTLYGRSTNSGFTLVEILIVVSILAIAAMIAIPMMSSAGSMQIRSAANMIAADLEYAKSMAISRQKIYTVVFDPLSAVQPAQS